MTKPEALDTLMLLSALESWAFSRETMLPDYLHDRLSVAVELLRTEVLGRNVPPDEAITCCPPWESRK